MNFNIPIYDKKEVLSDEEASKRAILKAKFIYTSKKELYNKMKEEDNIYLFENIEMPLAKVLAKMEIEGIRVDKNILKEMSDYVSDMPELVWKKEHIQKCNRFPCLEMGKFIIQQTVHSRTAAVHSIQKRLRLRVVLRR